MFAIECFTCGPLGNNTYLLFSSNEAVVIDPATESHKKIQLFLEEKNLVLKEIWITHSHLDHTAGCKILVDLFSAKVAIHMLDAPNLTNPGKDLLGVWMPCEGVKPSSLLRDKDTLTLGKSVWTVIHTPGHSPGSVCFYNSFHPTLFSGDTLFRGTYGKCSFPTSDPILMGESLQRLSSLPDETIIYPGHGPKTTMGKEKSWLNSLSLN